MSGCQPLLVMSRGCSCAPLVVAAGVIRPLLCCVGSPGLTESVLPHVLSGAVCVGCRLLPLLCLGLGLHIGLCVGSGGPCGFMILHTYAVRSPASSGSFCAYLPSALLPALLPFCSTFLPCLGWSLAACGIPVLRQSWRPLFTCHSQPQRLLLLLVSWLGARPQLLHATPWSCCGSPHALHCGVFLRFCSIISLPVGFHRGCRICCSCQFTSEVMLPTRTITGAYP